MQSTSDQTHLKPKQDFDAAFTAAGKRDANNGGWVFVQTSSREQRIDTGMVIEDLVDVFVFVGIAGSSSFLVLFFLWGMFFYEPSEPQPSDSNLFVIGANWEEGFANLGAGMPSISIHGEDQAGFHVGEFSAKDVKILDPQMHQYCGFSITDRPELACINTNAITESDFSTGFDIPAGIQPNRIVDLAGLNSLVLLESQKNTSFSVPGRGLADIAPLSVNYDALMPVAASEIVVNARDFQASTAEVGFNLAATGVPSRENGPDSDTNAQQDKQGHDDVSVLKKPFSQSGHPLIFNLLLVAIAAIAGTLLYRKARRNARSSGTWWQS